MTSSQIFRPMKGVIESLTGRVSLLHMLPISQREIIGAPCVPLSTEFNRLLSESKNILPIITPEVFEHIRNGYMPGIVSGKYCDRNIYCSLYPSTYIERDVLDISGSVDALKYGRGTNLADFELQGTC